MLIIMQKTFKFKICECMVIIILIKVSKCYKNKEPLMRMTSNLNGILLKKRKACGIKNKKKNSKF